MLNIDEIIANEQLFTELTPEEGAVVEGGAVLHLVRLLPNSPSPGQNDPAILVGTSTVYSQFNVNDPVNLSGISRSYTGNTTLSIWDQDPGANNDDLLTFRIIGQQSTNGLAALSSGEYTLTYRIT